MMVSLLVSEAHAGVFSAPRFVLPGQFSVGLEPELVFLDGAGVGLNIKYTHGIAEMADVIGIIGTGSSPRRFRVGSGFTLDIFPDIEGQPGIGLGGQGVYYRYNDHGQFDLTVFPYLHKTFQAGETAFEPYLSVPIGLAFYAGRYYELASVAVGSIFDMNAHVSYVFEIGVSITNTTSYVSGGLVYYH